MVSRASPAFSFIFLVPGSKAWAACAIPLGAFLDFANRSDVGIVPTVMAAYGVNVDSLETHVVHQQKFEAGVLMR